MNFKKNSLIIIQESIISITVIMIIFLSVFFIAFIEYANNEVSEIVVKEKYIKRNGEEDRYIIVTENNDTYKITDLIFKGKFNSSDIYNQLEIGKKYKIKTSGYRIPFLSEFKNINKVEEIIE